MECRGCLATLDPVDDRLTLWSSTQTPLVAARLLAELLGREETSIRVLAPDVGGGFGPKLVFYPEEAAVAIAAIMLNKPVKWIEDRREHFVSTTQERDQYWDAEIALDNDGKILASAARCLHDHGAYTARGLTVPRGAVASLTLAYVVPAYRWTSSRAHEQGARDPGERRRPTSGHLRDGTAPRSRGKCA